MLSGRVPISAILEDSLDRDIRERAKAKASERGRKRSEETVEYDDDVRYSTQGGKSASSSISSVPARTATPESVRSVGPKVPLPKLRQTLTSKSIDEGKKHGRLCFGEGHRGGMPTIDVRLTICVKKVDDEAMSPTSASS